MKVIKICICVCISFLCIARVDRVYAEDYSNTEYWSETCKKATKDNQEACKGYAKYLESKKSEAQEQLKSIEAKRDQIAANIAAYDQELKDLQAKITDLQTQIDAKQAEIDAKQLEIDNKQKEIDATQAQVDALKEKVKKRMVNAQSTMRVSKYTDILMGASTFEEFIRIANGLGSIAQYDENTMDQLASLIEKLNDEKQALENAKVEMEVAKQELLNKQDDLEAAKASKQIIIDEQERQAAELEALGDTISASIDSIKSAISKIDLNGVVAAEGWTNPVPGAYRSAGTWNYSGGGKHLGYDFAASRGTNIYAVANGVVVNSADGCSYGGLGSTCHGSGGSSGGGNQVYLVVAVGDTLYAVKYLHMQNGSPIPTGTKVTGGDYIGRVGSTGNSSGPHCHIEIFKIGAASDFASYVKNWNGDLTFGCGWAGSYDGYGRRCEAGYGIPCRIRPESVFGG